ncbi:MAG TPA: hypothetical protein PKA62_10130 [Thermoanaerobaculia bacterium]|nr:hypothetical protein [Thermoanaerobaculia bacterium]
MIELLGNPLFAVTFLIFGAAVLIFIVRRNRAREEAAKGPSPAARKARTAPVSRSATSPAIPTPERRASGGSPDAASLPSGFRDLTWGSAPVEGMQLVAEDGEHRFLSRPTDSLRIGRAVLTSITYVYERGRLQAVVVELPASGFELLLRQLPEDWGPPRTLKAGQKYAWSDMRAGDEATQAILEKPPASRTAKLVVSAKAVSAARTRDAGATDAGA